MNQPDTADFVFHTHPAAEEAIRTLGHAGLYMRRLSRVGKGYQTEEHPTGFCTVGDRIKNWGRTGAFWGGIWGLLLNPAVFVLPGLGVVAMAGPIVATLVGALEGAVLVGGLSALGAALMQIGVPKGQIMKYEADLMADKSMRVVHGVVPKTRPSGRPAGCWPRRQLALLLRLVLGTLDVISLSR